MREIARTKISANSTATVPRAVKLFLGLEGEPEKQSKTSFEISYAVDHQIPVIGNWETKWVLEEDANQQIQKQKEMFLKYRKKTFGTSCFDIIIQLEMDIFGFIGDKKMTKEMEKIYRELYWKDAR